MVISHIEPEQKCIIQTLCIYFVKFTTNCQLQGWCICLVLNIGSINTHICKVNFYVFFGGNLILSQGYVSQNLLYLTACFLKIKTLLIKCYGECMKGGRREEGGGRREEGGMNI